MAKRSLTVVVVLCLFFLGLTLMAEANEGEVKEVQAVGVADGKSSKARDEALNDALRKAVEQGVGTFVTAELTVEQQRLVEERIFTESKGYIQGYKVVREGSKDGLYEVEVSALVKMGKLSGDLESIGLLIRKKQNPRVMVVVYSRETNTSPLGVELEGNRNVESQIESALLQKGFQLVDAGQVNRKKQLEGLLLKNDPTRAGKLARDFGAEILVEADVRRTFAGDRQVYGRSMRFFSNEVRMKALETDTAKVLYSGYKTRPASGAEAFLPLEEATGELIDEMTAGILEQWRKDVFQAGSYQIEVAGISFNDLSKFKEGLKKIRGVSDVQVRSFQSGHASLGVKYQGPAQELAEKIGAMKGPRPEIRGLQANTIEVGIRK
ncbi:MAG: hypothetical protein JXL84_14780 [Deltaproteobacteria bacterium]|nr:hypothetical protein [Deltaproteobacteria bacterium]